MIIKEKSRLEFKLEGEQRNKEVNRKFKMNLRLKLSFKNRIQMAELK